MGGSCCICGYKKCDAALALHHLDPSKKDISLGAIRANPKNWAALVAELRKCVLLCNICHTEVHYNMAVVPENAPSFNEMFADYKAMLTKDEYEQEHCPVCNGPKANHIKTCSLSCSGKMSFRVDWNSIDLEMELRTKSNCQIAEALGCTETSVRKRLKLIRSGKTNTNAPAKPSIKTICFKCGKPVKRYHSAKAVKRNFCSRQCRDAILNNEGWPSNNELLQMRNSYSIETIATKLHKGLSAVYSRIAKINKFDTIK